MSTVFMYIAFNGLVIFTISRVITSEAGPFSIFDRLRFALLPAIYRRWLWLNNDLVDDSKDIEESIADNVMFLGAHLESYETIEEILKWEKSYTHSFKGTLRGILTCECCMGLWVSFVSSLFFLQFMPYSFWLLFPFASVAVQRMLIKWL